LKDVNHFAHRQREELQLYVNRQKEIAVKEGRLGVATGGQTESSTTAGEMPWPQPMIHSEKSPGGRIGAFWYFCSGVNLDGK